MKIGDRVKVVNPNSTFCGEEGIVDCIERTQIDVRIDDRNDELMFYIYELELVK